MTIAPQTAAPAVVFRSPGLPLATAGQAFWSTVLKRMARAWPPETTPEKGHSRGRGVHAGTLPVKRDQRLAILSREGVCLERYGQGGSKIAVLPTKQCAQ